MLDILFRLGREFKTMLGLRARRCAKPKRYFKIKLFWKSNYFLLIVLHYKLWSTLTLAFSSSSVHFTCESQRWKTRRLSCAKPKSYLKIKLFWKSNYFLLIVLHYKLWSTLTLAFSSSSVHFTCESQRWKTRRSSCAKPNCFACQTSDFDLEESSKPCQG